MGFFADRRAVKQFEALPLSWRSIVFYSEGAADWPHLSAVVKELVTTHGQAVSYLTSEASDPVFELVGDNLKAFYIGSGTMRTMLFKTISARLFVMTLPDLGTYHLKRSILPVHYAYLYHALNSTHRAYRTAAFDAYDTIFCVGPHHMAEIRETEKVYRLKAKNLVEHGYDRLDAIIRKRDEEPSYVPSPGPTRRVLLAPSWGECSFIEAEDIGGRLIQLLREAGHDLTLRLHPMTVRRFPKLADKLTAEYGGEGAGRFAVETNMDAQMSLQRSDIMISDWSGAGSEYAFGLERPVLYINMPMKVNNPEYQKIDMTPLEEFIRREIGIIIEPAALEEAPLALSRLCGQRNDFLEKVRSAREKWVYNVGSSAKVGAAELIRILNGLPEHKEIR